MAGENERPPQPPEGEQPPSQEGGQPPREEAGQGEQRRRQRRERRAGGRRRGGERDQREVREDREEQAEEVVERLLRRGEQPQVSAEDKEWFRNMSKTIREKIHQSDSLPPPQKLTPEEREKIDSFFYGDLPKEEVEEILAKLNIDSNDAERFSTLNRQIFSATGVESRHIDDPFLREKIEGAKREFNIKNLQQEGFFEYDTQGKLKFTTDPDKRRDFKKKVTKYYYYYFHRIDENTAQLYKDIYNPFIDGYYIQGLKGIFSEIRYSEQIIQRLDPKDYEEFTSYMRGISSYTYSLIYYGELFHDLPIYAQDPSSFENWSGFLGRLFPSETASFLDDDVMKITMSEVERHIRKRIALNNNKVPHDLFGGRYDTGDVIYHIKDQEQLVDSIRRRLDSLGIEYDPSWEIARAISYSRGIGLVNLRHIEIMGSADSTGTFKGIPDLIAKLIQRHKWGQGRGGFGITHIPELFSMDLVYNPSRRSFLSRLWKKRKWIPEKVYRRIEQERQNLGESVDRALLDRKGVFQDLMNIFNIGSLISRAGWRVDHLIQMIGKKAESIGLDFEKRDETWAKEEWEQLFDVAAKDMGVGSLWFFIDTRVNAEMKRALEQVLGKPVTDQELKQYALGTDLLSGHHVYDKIFELETLDENGNLKKVKVDYTDFKQAKEWQIKGEILNRLFKRSPGDFLSNLIQVVPELANFDPNDAASTIFNDAALNALSPKKNQQANALRKSIIENWGKENFERLVSIRQWLERLVNDTRLKGQLKDGRELKTEKDVFDYFLEQMGTALERTIQRSKGIKDEELKQKRTDLNMKDKEIGDEIIREHVFNRHDSLDEIINNFDEDFGDYDKVGNYGLFYNTAKLWSIKQGNMNPNTVDLDYFLLYQDIAQAGETVIRRLLSDVNTWDKVVSQISDLDELLMRTATETKDLSKIYELHDAIHSLEDIVGEDEAKRANYLLASLVASYFWDHSKARISGLGVMNFVTKFALGRRLSLSRLHGNAYSFVMEETEIRNYFRVLAFEKNAIHQRGRNSAEMGQLAFDSKTDTFIVGNVIPSILLVMALYMTYTAIKKAAEEEDLGPKKSR